MTPITIAIGPEALAKAQALQQSIPSLVILTETERRPEHEHENPALSARLMKSAFATYLPLETSGPVALLDADMEAAVENPFSELPELTAPVAGVAWMSGVHYPGPYAGIPKDFPALNSGFLAFPDLASALVVCEAWHAAYLSNLPKWTRDEPNLCLALHTLQIMPQVLPSTFNARTEEGAILIHRPYVHVPRVIPPQVPHEIANWRARAVLEIAGLLPTVEALIAAMEGEAGVVVRMAWERGSPLVRDGATVTALAAQLNLTSEQIDAMFIQAAALEV